MASYQDLDIRVKMIEEKLALVLQCAQVTVGTPSTLMPGEMVKETISLGELYKRLRATGATLEPVKEEQNG